ncbi:MAG: uroporphyrinogen-III synthase [Hyphomicrobiales bacterium]|jgi:uroporphyrinogen-III synthase
MTRVLITRAQPQADATAKLVKARGFQPLVFPLTQTEALDDGVREVEAFGGNVDGIMVATSARAIEVLEGAGIGPWIGRQRWVVVGSRAAERLTKLGANLILPAARDVAGLIEGLKSRLEPLTYLAGADRKQTLEATFPAMRVIPVYQAKALGGFSAEALRHFSVEPPAFALVYSYRGAHLLSQAIRDAAIEDASLQAKMNAMQWLCLSQDVAVEAPPEAIVRIADAPTQETLLQLLA